jgi:4-alpha-glucanotransferase
MGTLDELAERSGIEGEFIDAKGDKRRTPADVQRALLATLGLPAASPSRVQVALDALDQAEWGRALPPVRVAWAEQGPVTVEVTLPNGTPEVAWRAQLEDGSLRNGRVVFDSLELLQDRKLDGSTVERRRLDLGSMPLGYHKLMVQPDGTATTLIVVPDKCWLPAQTDGQRFWGIAAQLYLLRSQNNWGIGDYSDLGLLVEVASSGGAQVIGVNPLHAMFLDAPEQASPYSPADRLLLNVLYIDVTAVPELQECAEAQSLLASPSFKEQLRACRDSRLVDYSGVTKLKLPTLRLLFKACRNSNGNRWIEFERFRGIRGALLQQGCLFQALREHFAALDPSRSGWHTWPEEYRKSGSSAVADFAQEHADNIAFHAWLQWIADTQLAEVAATDMQIGLYRDLAVGADRSGAETWSNPAAVVSAANVGAPPDIYNPTGQNWGLPPFHPSELRKEAYRSYVELLRANMRHAGALRIDHVMGLQHLYWIPEGQPPSMGAYVKYPVDDLVGILALESQRHRCLVVGEDLGTVPAGFRDRMSRANVLSYRVLFFERDQQAFLPPPDYPLLSLSVAGSHDLPTLRGWWEGADITQKLALKIFSRETAERLQQDREAERGHLLAALRAQGLIPAQGESDVESLARAVHGYLAKTNSIVSMAQIDDLFLEITPVNVPTITDEYPNWRRKQSHTIEELTIHPSFKALCSLMAAERGNFR